jgi:hypothetical protein
VLLVYVHVLLVYVHVLLVYVHVLMCLSRFVRAITVTCIQQSCLYLAWMLTLVRQSIVCKPQVPITKVKVTGSKVIAYKAHNFKMHFAILFIFCKNVNLSETECCTQTPWFPSQRSRSQLGVKDHIRCCLAHNFDMHWANLFIFGMNVNLSEAVSCANRRFPSRRSRTQLVTLTCIEQSCLYLTLMFISVRWRVARKSHVPFSKFTVSSQMSCQIWSGPLL